MREGGRRGEREGMLKQRIYGKHEMERHIWNSFSVWVPVCVGVDVHICVCACMHTYVPACLCGG